MKEKQIKEETIEKEFVIPTVKQDEVVGIEEVEQEGVDRSELNIQQFMNDMQMLGMQVRDRKLVKPTFHYGDASVTNYLLWLLLGEIMMLNDKMNEVEE